jgi:hypothetical protein
MAATTVENTACNVEENRPVKIAEGSVKIADRVVKVEQRVVKIETKLRVNLQRLILDEAAKFAPDLVLFSICSDAPMDAELEAHKTFESLLSSTKEYIEYLCKNKVNIEVYFIFVDKEGGYTSWLKVGKKSKYRTDLMFYNLLADQWELISKYHSEVSKHSNFNQK